MKRKRFAMYEMFGRARDICGNCCHLKGDKGSYRKCEIYGISHSEATDWALSWQACGAFNLLHVPQVNIYKSLPRSGERLEKPLEGQIEFDV